ncbi:helix-turn-helix domain-containing protein [Pararhizobium sp.]|uniref:helix-turn-helix domain-containing protein n=1 Tax=Pararhizobium sp. TaxID=1977563 RepID=UPI0027243846|nr:helix-turn-helix domain-containing protein [Pararhizobium sp.]MDO9416996.1 replication/maintenance protein RepL [Pararhizobium sp.]
MAKNNIDSFYTERGAWTDYVCDRLDFTHAQFRVAYFIASKTNPRDGYMWYSVKRIARESGVSLKTVTDAIEHLDRCRLITIGKRKEGRQTVNTYAWRMPLDASDQAFKAVKKGRRKTGGRARRVSLDET